ncbi:hypothetical protein ASPZODRAFT_890329 [Penicilliopsis zonata CBS 506.65]|uniref:Transcription factor domain-containing protein n=1 Tax=Penicilliopsis zonata CBS 506.65 TaxID=1073090 RepID=A0A1L9S9P7_9EURO|nr:hypothetical protein ASPZODRAFT_890329 [Penicilliopsis zonata CBS 506.65]OJJ43876.1 hypothetical protein ASPZODRAFT_890329 [Penicilliopsis zonata CBS 506.65]
MSKGPASIDLTFITVQHSRDGLKASGDRTVRSHVTRYQWRKHNEQRRREAISSGRMKRRTGEFLPLRMELDCTALTGLRRGNSADDVTPGQGDRELDSDTNEPVRVLPIPRLVGGHRVDPFRSYPVSWKPFFPSLVDHYLVHMAVDIPELDQPGNQGLLRTRWFPLVISEPALFHVILLIAASHHASVHGSPDSLRLNLLQLRHAAVQSINDALAARPAALGDALIGAVAKMASYEAMFGTTDHYNIHMQGLIQLIRLRGGFGALGLDGLLRRIVIWIDRNAAHLHQLPLYFPGLDFASGRPLLEPSPSHFLGFS